MDFFLHIASGCIVGETKAGETNVRFNLGRWQRLLDNTHNDIAIERRLPHLISKTLNALFGTQKSQLRTKKRKKEKEEKNPAEDDI